MSNPTADILKPLDRIQRRGYRMSKVFRDWVRLMLYSLQRRDEPYLEVMDRYPNDRPEGEREADLFAEAFAELMGKMGEDSESGAEPREYLGDIYMEVAGNYSVQDMGQYFTPQPICDFMAKATIAEVDEESPRVADPACGSGRLLHSAAKLLPPTAHFAGIDLDSVCAHMAALNLTFFNMNGVILHGNSLTLEYYNGWMIKRTTMGAKIQELTEDEVEKYTELLGEEFKKAEQKRENSSQPAATDGNSLESEQLALF